MCDDNVKRTVKSKHLSSLQRIIRDSNVAKKKQWTFRNRLYNLDHKYRNRLHRRCSAEMVKMGEIRPLLFIWFQQHSVHIFPSLFSRDYQPDVVQIKHQGIIPRILFVCIHFCCKRAIFHEKKIFKKKH